MAPVFKINVQTFNFSDGSRLAGTFRNPFDIYIIPAKHQEMKDKDGMPMFFHPDHRHFNAIMFARPASVGISFRSQCSPEGPGVVKRVQFNGGTTVRQFLTGMLALAQKKASQAESMRVYGKPKRHTYGCMLGDHVYFEGMRREGRGRYTIDFGS